MAATVALLAANLALTFYNTYQVRRDAHLESGSHEVLTALQTLLGLATDAETGQRGYLITGEESYLGPYLQAVASIEDAFHHLEHLSGDHRARQAQLLTLRESMDAKLRELDQTVSLRRQSGFDDARQVVLTNVGKKEMDALRTAIASMMSEERTRLEDRRLHGDRSYRFALATGAVSGLASLAAVAGFLLLLRRHLAERTAAAGTLAEQAERLSVTLASIGDAVIATDTAARITHLNPVAEALTGWSSAEAVGRPLDSVFRIVNETTRQPVDNPAHRALREGMIVGLANHTVLLAKTGAEHPIDDSAAPIRGRDGQILGCVLVFRDVAERRRSEAELQRAHDELERRVAERTAQLVHANAFLHALLENLQEGIVACDAGGTLTLFNQATRRFHGLPQEALPAERWAEHYDLYRPDGATRMTRDEIPLFRALRGEHVKDAEMVIAPKGGGPLTLLASGQPLQDEAGRVIGAVVSMHDITRRKRAEESLHRTNEELERRIAARTGELTRANDELVSAQETLRRHAAELETRVAQRTADLRAINEQLEAYVYSIAHDLRGPLRSINGFSQLLQSDHAAELDETAGDYLKRIQTAAEFMDRLLIDLLAYGRTTRTEMELGAVDVAKAWADALFLTADQLERTQASVEAIAPLPTVRAHDATLTQCLANLLSNAMKFTPAGAQPRIRLRAEPKDGAPGRVRLWVEDNGIGIAPEHHEKIFRVFERLHGTRYEGTGIGLSIVRKGIERMGGKVGLESALGSGSRFWIELERA